MQKRRDLKPFVRIARIIPAYPNGFTCQNGTVLIRQLNAAKQFYIFTALTCIYDLAKGLVWGRVYKYYIRKMIVDRAY